MSAPTNLPPAAASAAPLADLLESATFAPPRRRLRRQPPPPSSPRGRTSAPSLLPSPPHPSSPPLENPPPAPPLAPSQLRAPRAAPAPTSSPPPPCRPAASPQPRISSPPLLFPLPPSPSPSAPPPRHALHHQELQVFPPVIPAQGGPAQGILAVTITATILLRPSVAFCQDLEQGSESCDGIDHLALAGIGYALASADELSFGRIIGSLFRICGRIGNLGIGIRVLKLVEWLVMGFVESRKMRKVQVLFKILSPENCESEGYVLFPVVMAACGGLRALRVSAVRLRLDFDPKLKEAPERTIRFAAERANVEGRNGDDPRRVLLQCVALGLTRCGQVSFHDSVLRCVCTALLEEFLPLPHFLRMSIKSPDGHSAELVKDQVKQHQDSILFSEAGPTTGVLCNQYSLADQKAKDHVETRVCEYAQELYHHLRAAVLLHQAKRKDLLGEIDNKIADAVFSMVVMFAAEVTKHRLDASSSGGFQPEVAVRILVVFSCVEHLRRLRLPEYTEAIQGAVIVNQENAAAAALFVESMPSCSELTSKPDLLTADETRYACYMDEVQTSRILFYLRVMPTCITLIPAHTIRDTVAPIYTTLERKVTRAAHSLMVSFLSSGTETDQDDREAVKEQLAFDYIGKSLEVYPGVTPLEGLVSGVVALVRHLPAKSPAILFSVHSLVVKAKDLCSSAMVLDRSLWRSWEESTEPCKKMSDLLLRLIFLVDIQSFSYLLKELAEFVTWLPKEGQDVLLDDMHASVADSDDVIRKPVLVSWLQSLSYISSQANVRESRNNAKIARSTGGVELSLNRTVARL